MIISKPPKMIYISNFPSLSYQQPCQLGIYRTQPFPPPPQSTRWCYSLHTHRNTSCGRAHDMKPHRTLGPSSLLELLHLEDVVLLGILRRLVLDLLPRIPLGLALQVEYAWPGGVHLPHGGHLEQAVKDEQVVVRRLRFQVLHILRGLLEVLVHAHCNRTQGEKKPRENATQTDNRQRETRALEMAMSGTTTSSRRGAPTAKIIEELADPGLKWNVQTSPLKSTYASQTSRLNTLNRRCIQNRQHLPSAHISLRETY